MILEACANFYMPNEIIGYYPVITTKKVDKKQLFFNKILRREQKYEEINETVQKEIRKYDFTKVDAILGVTSNKNVRRPYRKEDGSDGTFREVYLVCQGPGEARKILCEYNNPEEFPFRNKEAITDFGNKVDEALRQQFYAVFNHIYWHPPEVPTIKAEQIELLDDGIIIS